MPLKGRRGRKAHSAISNSVSKLTDQLFDDEILDELSRTGVVWAGILGLEDALLPSEVAAMISSYELVKATRLVESEPHWVNAASYAAIGAFSDTEEKNIDPLISSNKDDEEDQLPIGFAPGHITSPKN